MPVTKGTRKRPKTNKNRRKSWGKFSDITEVEEFLEEKRFEERIGGPVSEKPNDELFFIQSGREEPAQLKKVFKKPLKCHQNIGVFSCVPSPINVDINRYPKRIKNILERAEDRIYKKALSQKEKPKKNQTSEQATENNEFNDLWAKEEKVDEEIRDLIEYRDEITMKKKPKFPAHRYQKPSLLPAVEIPDPGASYNPSYEDHQKLLRKAVDVEERLVQKELALKQALDDMFPTREEAPTEESKLKEMSQGLFEEADDEPEPENKFILRNPPVSYADRRTKARKRKRKQLLAEAKKRASEKLQNQRDHEIYRLQSIKSEIRKWEALNKQREEGRTKIKIEQMYKPRQLSQHRYVAPDIEVNLTEELTGSLRKIKTDGSLLEDRFKSLQRRNIIEPRVRQKRKKRRKPKIQVKRSHRNFE